MKKNQFNTLCVCLTFVISSGDCFGMENNSPDSKKTVINSNDISGSTATSNSPKSDDCSIGKTEEEWIKEHEELISRACCQKQGIIDLLTCLRAKPYSEASSIYQKVLSKWNDKNVYEIINTGNSLKGYYEKEEYDF